MVKKSSLLVLAFLGFSVFSYSEESSISSSSSGVFFYKVKEGDTVSSIAKEYCMTKREIYRLNPSLAKRGKLVAGKLILLKKKSGCKVDMAPESKVEVKKVEEKEDKKVPVEPLRREQEEPQDKFSLLSKQLQSYSTVFEIADNSGYKTVRIALKDINLIECPSGITGYTYSKEKNLITRLSDDKKFLYVKVAPISIQEPDSEKPILKYEDYPREMYVECNGKSYSLILVPEDIPSQMIRIKSVASKDDNRSSYAHNSFEASVIAILREIYTTPVDAISYDIKPLKVNYKYKEMEITGVREYYTGSFKVSEYVVINKTDGALKLSEGLFLSLSKYPVAIMLTNPIVEKGGNSVLYIVEKI